MGSRLTELAYEKLVLYQYWLTKKMNISLGGVIEQMRASVTPDNDRIVYDLANARLYLCLNTEKNIMNERITCPISVLTGIRWWR